MSWRNTNENNWTNNSKMTICKTKINLHISMYDDTRFYSRYFFLRYTAYFNKCPYIFLIYYNYMS